MQERALRCKKGRTLRSAKEEAVLSLEDLDKYVKEWIFDCEFRQHSKSTVDVRRLMTRNLIWFLNHRDYSDVGTPELKQFSITSLQAIRKKAADGVIINNAAP
jgi:hypothetical protein